MKSMGIIVSVAASDDFDAANKGDNSTSFDTNSANENHNYYKNTV